MSDKHLPLVSVITPAYNQGIFLRETIDSVLSQDYPNIELIVLNDGSTDNTEEILKEYTGRIYWETQTNMGQTPTINKGWKLSKGEIITWLNSDDTYMPGAVRSAVEYLENHPDTGIVFGESIFTKADGTLLSPSLPLDSYDYDKLLINCENPIAQPSTFIRRTVLERIGLLDPLFYYFMDWDYWLRAGLFFQIEHVPEIWSTYRLHDESKTVSQALRAAPELGYMYRKYFDSKELSIEILNKRRTAFANMYFRSAGYYKNGGSKKMARKMAMKALWSLGFKILNPSNLRKFLYCVKP